MLIARAPLHGAQGVSVTPVGDQEWEGSGDKDKVLRGPTARLAPAQRVGEKAGLSVQAEATPSTLSSQPHCQF